jgi:hypothetical protein
MALSPIEDRYLSALTEREFPTFTPDQALMASPDGVNEPAMPPGQRPGDVLVAEVGSRNLPSQAFTGQYPDRMEAFEPTTRQRLASFLQAGFEGMGVDRFRARQQAQSLIGGPSSNLPLTMGIADIVPLLGTGLQIEEGVEMGKEAKQAADRGDYGQAALLGTGAVLSVVPGAVPTVKALTKAGKAVAPKVGEMAETMLQKQGLMPSIVERTTAGSPSIKREEFTAYQNQPQQLQGFPKGGPSKSFDEQKYKHAEFVEVKFEDGTTHVDAIRGLNKPHALSRAFGNWPDATEIKPLARSEVEQLDPDLIKEVDAVMPKQAQVPSTTEVTPQLVQERVPGVQPGEELIVQHNLTAANLVKADKLGGLPVPSLAISRAANPMDNFGEITLIAPKEFANPSAKNPVFGADAYTARFPKIDYQIDSKSKKPLRGLVADVIDKLPGGDYNFERLMNDWSDRQYNQILRAKFLDERGALPDPKEFNESWKFNSTVDQLVRDNQSEYQDWLAKFDDSLADAGVNVKERIFKGFTYAGDRRYAAATLDNIVKEMKGGAGSEGFNYGVGNLRAVATPKFRTLSQVKAARGKLVDGKKMDEIKQQAQDAYVSVLERMREVNDQYSAEDALLEFAESKRMSTLDRLYDGKMPDELKADISIFLQKIQELPTEYFELKPQRAVSLEEFKGAIIPANTPQSARDVLTKAGVTDIYEYSTPEERKSLFQKYGKEMFTAAPGGTALGAATMQDEENK